MCDNKNKGKSGEMVLLNIISSTCHVTDKLEITRPSKTNSADLGLDMSLSGPKKEIEKFINHAIPERTQPKHIENIDENKIVKARIDSKNFENRITKVEMKKFVSETAIHSDSTYHLLMGGRGLTKGAQEVINNAAPLLEKQGIEVIHITHEGIDRLSDNYPPVRPEKKQKKIK